jgi:hypothetical protein
MAQRGGDGGAATDSESDEESDSSQSVAESHAEKGPQVQSPNKSLIQSPNKSKNMMMAKMTMMKALKNKLLPPGVCTKGKIMSSIG